MSALRDAKRFLVLRAVGATTSGDPYELLIELVDYVERYGAAPKLVSENIQLKSRLAEITKEFREILASKRAIAEVLSARESELRSLRTQTQCQTSLVGSSRVQRSPEAELDQLASPDFVPCRDERCRRADLHAVGQCGDAIKGRGPYRKKNRHA